jgi:methionine-rich copper-binding protein CopC
MRNTLILILTLASISLAQAHAFLDHADPKVGSTVAAPSQVQVFMTMDLMKKTYTTLQVFDAKGAEVDNKDVRIDAATMVVSVPKLPAGTYTVAWKALAVCGHKTSGTFSFTVN